MKKIYIETLGCSKNQVDSEKMSFLLEEKGLIIANQPDEADYIIINTCCFIREAKEEAIETIFEYVKYKKEGKCKKLIVAGCMAQYYSNALKEEIPEIDIIFGVGNIAKIVEALDQNQHIVLPEFTQESLIKRNLSGFPGTAYLKISDGCSNYCSYCIIPLIRGEHRSRDINSILEEVEMLKSKNVKEIIIVGQDTSNYGIDIYKKRMLAELILQIDSILKNESWIRVLYMHPDHINEELFIKLKEARKLVPYFDIPFQSGSTKVLKSMNREGNSETYLQLIKNIHSIFGDAVIRSTFIAGFPGETEKDFADTLNFIEKAQIDWIGGFKYSREESSIAGNMKNQIKDSIKKKRLHQIFKLSEQITKIKLQRFLGTNQKILIEEQVAGENLYLGRFWGQAPEVDGLTVVDSFKATPGEFITTSIKKLNEKDFYAIGCLPSQT